MSNGKRHFDVLRDKLGMDVAPYYSTGGFIASTCAFNLLTCEFQFVTRGFELVTRRFELVTSGFELVTSNLIIRVLLFLYHLLLPCSRNCCSR